MGWFRKQRELLELKLILEQDKLYKEAFDFWIKNTGAFIPTPMSDRALSMGLAIIHSKQNTMTRQDYITAIRNGEYCIENDDKISSLALIDEIFPNDPSGTGASNFYFRDSGNPNKWVASNIIQPGMKSIKASTLANMKDETKIINPKQAQQIINAACKTWKRRLANIWGASMALDEHIHISEEFYQEMRSACTPDQHKLFDEIFGPEFKVGNHCKITGHDGIYTIKRVRMFEIDDHFALKPIGVEDPNSAIMCGSNSLRHATPEEIRAAQYPPDGTPCWVRDSVQYAWGLRYANGNGLFYMDQHKEGVTETWEYSMPFDPNNLPFNK